MKPNTKFIQGAFPFEGDGFDTPRPLGIRALYQVPPDKRAQLIYMRAGNPTSELVALLLTRNSRPMRYFPVGAKATSHVSLAVVEDIFPESNIEIFIIAPAGHAGMVIVDFGFVELD